MKNELLIIGMSPGNGYFKQEVIDKILVYALSHYKHIGIFIPDIPAISTYVALGYPENIAHSKKAIPQGNNFKNRVARSIQKENLDSNKITIFDWQKENIENNSNYRTEYNYLKKLYLTNKDFERDINEATEQVLVGNPFRKKDIELKDIKKGTHYILSEFAFMTFLPKYKKEYESFYYAYHKPWPVWEKFISGSYDGIERSNLNFIQLPDFSIRTEKVDKGTT
jgi:tRNA-dependent cyclodipeptide synthase